MTKYIVLDHVWYILYCLKFDLWFIAVHVSLFTVCVGLCQPHHYLDRCLDPALDPPDHVLIVEQG